MIVDNSDENRTNSDWLYKIFDGRQQSEILFSVIYAEQFHHGTDGHNAKMIIAKMKDLLDHTEVLLNAVNRYRIARGRVEAGEDVGHELIDAYIAMLAAADKL